MEYEAALCRTVEVCMLNENLSQMGGKKNIHVSGRLL